MASVVDELFAPMEAAARGLIDNPTTLATVILCESVLQYVPTCETLNTQYATLRACGVTNTNLALHGRLMLDRTQVGMDSRSKCALPEESVVTSWVPS